MNGTSRTLSLACLALFTCAAQGGVTPIQASVNLLSIAQAHDWPNSNTFYVEDTCNQGLGAWYGTVIGNPPAPLGCTTSADSSHDDGGILRTIHAEADLGVSWSSASQGSVDFTYGYQTANVVSGRLAPASGSNFQYWFVSAQSGNVVVDYAVSGVTADIFPFFMYDIRLYQDMPILANLKEWRPLYPDDLLAGASGQYVFPITGGVTYILAIQDAGSTAGGLGDRLGTATGAFAFDIQAIPEPGNAVLMLSGLVAVGWYVGRRGHRRDD